MLELIFLAKNIPFDSNKCLEIDLLSCHKGSRHTCKKPLERCTHFETFFDFLKRWQQYWAFSRIFLLEIFSPYSNEDVLDQKDVIFWNGTHKSVIFPIRLELGMTAPRTRLTRMRRMRWTRHSRPRESRSVRHRRRQNGSEWALVMRSAPNRKPACK